MNEAIASFYNTTSALRVQVCNLNLEVYVFLGVVTVQLGIACSNYRVQVTNRNPPEDTEKAEKQGADEHCARSFKSGCPMSDFLSSPYWWDKRPRLSS